jgi:hypothetical protein
MTVSPGETVRAELSSYIRSADSIAGSSNSVQMKIEFYSLYGAARGSASFLGEVAEVVADGGSPNDVWVNHRLAGLAPTGTAEARLVIEFVQPAGQSGSVHIDSVEFGVAAPGDFNGDGSVDGADLEAWRHDFGAQAGAAADADGDGDADGADLLMWQLHLGNGNGAPLAESTSAAPECCTSTLGCIAGVAVSMAKAFRNREPFTTRRSPLLQ